MSFLEGFLTGVGTIIFLGPVFFTLLQITLDRGLKAGFSVAIGILSSDILIVFLFYFGAREIFQDDEIQFWLAAIGGIVLLVLGLKYIWIPAVSTEIKLKASSLKTAGAFVNGFLVNFVNPFVFLVWISIITYAEGKFDTQQEVGVYISAALLGILATDSIKVLLAHRLKALLNPILLKRLFTLIGIVLIGFSIRLFVYVAMQSIS